MDTLIAELSEVVKGKVLSWLCGRGLLEVASLTVIQDAMTRVGRAAAQAVGAAWREALVQLAEAVRDCPRCGRRRKLKWRSAQPLRVERGHAALGLPRDRTRGGRGGPAQNGWGTLVIKSQTQGLLDRFSVWQDYPTYRSRNRRSRKHTRKPSPIAEMNAPRRR